MSDKSRVRQGLWRALGALLLAAGVGLAVLAPLEMYCFTFFEEGGRFAYPGFGYGSFMFALMAAQILGYLALAAMLAPLGYAHLAGRPWTRTLGLGLHTAWLVAGPPFLLAALLVLLGQKELSTEAGVAAAAIVIALYPLGLWALRRLYGHAAGRQVRATAEAGPLPPALAGLAIVYGLEILALYVLTMLRGLTPLFGRWLTDLPGSAVLGAGTVALAALAAGTLARRRWAWVAGLAVVGAAAISTVATLAGTNWAELLTLMRLPETELGFLRGIPAQGWHLAMLAGLPLGLQWGAIYAASAAFRR